MATYPQISTLFVNSLFSYKIFSRPKSMIKRRQIVELLPLIANSFQLHELTGLIKEMLFTKNVRKYGSEEKGS